MITFLNPNFTKTELIVNQEYIVIEINKEKQKIEKKKFLSMKIKNSKEAELIFEGKKILVDKGDSSSVDNKIGQAIIIFNANEKEINLYVKQMIQQIIMINLDKESKDYINQITETIIKLKKVLKIK